MGNRGGFQTLPFPKANIMIRLTNKQQARQVRARLNQINKSDAQENILKWVERATAKIPNRPAYTWGHVGECLGKPALAASDGYRIHISWVGIENLPEWVQFKKSVNRHDIPFPDYPAIIQPEDYLHTVLFSAPMLIAAVKCAQVFGRDSAQCITFNFDAAHKQVEIKGISAERGDVKTIIEIGGLTQSCSFNLAANFVVDALKIWEHHQMVEMQFNKSSPDKMPILIGVRRYKMALIMPMSKTR